MKDIKISDEDMKKINDFRKEVEPSFRKIAEIMDKQFDEFLRKRDEKLRKINER